MTTTTIPVLDHGYVKFIESYGSDESIVEAARMSTGKGFLRWDAGPCPACATPQITAAEFVAGEAKPESYRHNGPGCAMCEGKGHVPGDMKLLKRLWSMRHATPFEMGGMIIEIQAPIFVFREWHRHRTQSYNEMSARYVPLPDVNYIPSVDRLMMNAREAERAAAERAPGGIVANKQAGVIKGAEILTVEQAEVFREELAVSYGEAELLYQAALKCGVPKELARVHLPVGRYSRMRASCNLRNIFAFLDLRLPASAQWEIRQYAEAWSTFVESRFPRSFQVYTETNNERAQTSKDALRLKSAEDLIKRSALRLEEAFEIIDDLTSEVDEEDVAASKEFIEELRAFAP